MGIALELRGGGHAAVVAFCTRSGTRSQPGCNLEASGLQPITGDLALILGVTSPNARYIQWKLELAGGTGVDSVTIAYLPQNTPPAVRSINVSTLASAVAKSSNAVSGTASYTVNVTDSGDAAQPVGTPSQTVSRIAGQQIQVSWQADDPDGDRLIYNLYFRGEDEREWKLLRANMTENTYLLEADVLADGRYFFKVIASDRPSNAAASAREADLVSAPVLIDNTPPVVTASTPRRVGTALEIDVDADDRGSVLRRCEISVDAGPWSPVEASDGVTDSARERFPVRIENFPQGEHLISIRVYDAAGNAGLTKVVVR